MNDLFIQGLTIDWNRVRPYNYVRQMQPVSSTMRLSMTFLPLMLI